MADGVRAASVPCPLRRRLIRLGMGLPLLVLLPREGDAMGKNREFRFEDHGGSSNEEAQKAVSAHLDALFPAGTPVEQVTSYLERAGADCGELPKYPNFVYCTYNHSASGLRAPFITVEWKILVWHEGRKERVTKIKVNRGMTGL